MTKPVNSQFFMTCWYIGINNIIRFIIGVLFVGSLLYSMHVFVSFLYIMQFFVLLILSVSIIYSIWLAVLTLIIWFTKLSNLVDLLYSLNGIARFPSQIYQHISPILFGVFFPWTLIAVIPAKALINLLRPTDMLVQFIVAIVLFFFTSRFWKFALRFYTSASG